MAVIEIPRGLNIAKSLIDVDKPSEALANLGLRINDLNLIRGLSDAGIDVTELHTLSGLKDDQNRIFDALDNGSVRAQFLANQFKEVNVDQEYNYSINNRMIAGAIKYGYIDYDEPTVTLLSGLSNVSSGTLNATSFTDSETNTTKTLVVGDVIRIGGSSSLTSGDYKVHTSPQPSATAVKLVQLNGSSYTESLSDLSGATFSLVRYWDVKQADISTSRVSSWSPIGVAPADPDSYITYGAKLSCTGEFLSTTNLGLTQEPVPQEFRAEQPTHNIQLNINGEFKTFPAMKGIPLTFRITAGAPGIFVGVNEPFLSDAEGTIPVAFKRFDIQNQAFVGQPTESAPNTVTNLEKSYTGKAAQYNPSQSNRQADIQIFYPPDRINYLDMNALFMNEFPFIVLPSLTSIEISNNQFSVLPDFATIAPSLRRLYASENPLFAGENFLDDLGVTYPDGSTTTQQKNLVAQAQLNRIPPTVEDLRLQDCFSGNIGTISLAHITNLEKFKIGNASSNNLTDRITSTGTTPAMADPNYRASFSSSNVTTGNASTHKIQISSHQFSTGDFVQYIARVDDSNNLGVAPGGLTSSSASDTSVGTQGNVIYKIISLDSNHVRLTSPTDTDGNTDSTFSISSTGSGNFHELVKWNYDASDSKLGEKHTPSSVGAINYDVTNAGYTRISNSVLNSKRLEKLNVRGLVITGNGDYQNKDSTNSATIAESEFQSAIYFDSKLLKQLNLDQAECNIPDISGNNNLTSLSIVNHDFPTSLETAALRDVSANKFVGLTSMTSFNFTNIGRNYNSNFAPRGDISNIFVDKESIKSITLNNVNGLEFILSDNTFGSGGLNSPNQLENFKFIMNANDPTAPVPNSTASNKGFDFFGVDGTANRTGQLFTGVRLSMQSIEIRGTAVMGGRLINDEGSTPIGISFVELENLKSLTISDGHFYGAIPTFTGLNDLETVNLEKTNKEVPFDSLKRKNIYEITQAPYGNTQGFYVADNSSNNLVNSAQLEALGTSGIMPHEIEDIGWSSSDTQGDVVPWGNNLARGSKPVVGDYFEYTPLGVNLLTQRMVYRITDLGSTTQAQWNTLAGTTSVVYKVGDTFTASNASNTIRESIVATQSGTSTYKIRRRYVISNIPSNTDWQSLITHWTGSSDAKDEGDTITVIGSNPGFPSGGLNYYAMFGLFFGNFFTKLSGAVDYGTGTVVRVEASDQITKSIGFTGSLGNMDNLDSMKTLNLQSNSLTGAFPAVDAPNLQFFKIFQNEFSGPIPDLSACTGLLEIQAQYNRFDSYTNNSRIDTCTSCLNFNFSNNALTSGAYQIIDDLYTNYIANTNRNATVNLTNNNGLSIASIQALGEGEGTTYEKLQTLLSSNWTVQIDAT